MPHASFQIFRQPDRHILALSPFRLGEQPNIRVGVAMITSAPEALALHDKMAKDLWHRAIKGPAAVRFMRELMDRQRALAPILRSLPRHTEQQVKGVRGSIAVAVLLAAALASPAHGAIGR